MSKIARYLERKINKFSIVALFLLVVAAIPVYALKRVWSSERLVYDAVLGVESVKGSPDKLLVWGKNYEKAEARIALVDIKDKSIRVIWESPNFYERGSNLMCAVGNFTSDQTEVILLTDSLWKIYRVDSNELKEVASGEGIKGVMEVTSGDIDGDGYTEVIMTAVNKLLRDTVDKKIVIYKYLSGDLVKIDETEGLGNVRAITALDFGNTGYLSVAVEIGLGYRKGEVSILDDLAPVLTLELCNQPIFALGHLGENLLVGDDSGYVALYRLKAGNKPDLELVGRSPSVGWGLVDVASGNFFGNQTEQVVVISSPTGISVLERK